MLYNVVLVARVYRWGHFSPSYPARPADDIGFKELQETMSELRLPRIEALDC